MRCSIHFWCLFFTPMWRFLEFYAFHGPTMILEPMISAFAKAFGLKIKIDSHLRRTLLEFSLKICIKKPSLLGFTLPLFFPGGATSPPSRRWRLPQAGSRRRLPSSRRRLPFLCFPVSSPVSSFLSVFLWIKAGNLVRSVCSWLFSASSSLPGVPPPCLLMFQFCLCRVRGFLQSVLQRVWLLGFRALVCRQWSMLVVLGWMCRFGFSAVVPVV